MKGATNHLTPGQRIAYYRRRRGMSQTVLAELVSRTLELFQPYLMQRSTPPHFVSNGDGLAERDYSHVPDVALAFRLAIEFDGHEVRQVCL